MDSETNTSEQDDSVMLPDEVWSLAIASRRVSPLGIVADVRLLDGSIYEDMLISDRGFVLGLPMDGLAGAHGGIDSSILSFETDDIEGIRIGRRHIWQRAIWLCLNPEHPARHNYNRKHHLPPPLRERVYPSIGPMITACVFFGAVLVFTVLAVIGLFYVFGWLK